MVARDGQIRRERIWTCAACPQGEGHGRPESINHQHADFQSNGEPGSVRVSRRPRTAFLRADRTDLADRAHAEPELRNSDRTRGGPIRFNGLRASRANSFRTGSRTGPRWVPTHSPSPPRSPPKFTTLQSGRYTVKSDPEPTLALQLAMTANASKQTQKFRTMT